jgi:VanZ family protein
MIKFIFSIPTWLRILLSLLYLGIIAKLSLMPPDEVPQIELFAGVDKLVHGFMYFGLTALACWSLNAEVKRIRILYIILFSAAFGLLMEVSQLEMQAGRAFEWIDEASNAIGSLLGAVVYAWIASK